MIGKKEYRISRLNVHADQSYLVRWKPSDDLEHMIKVSLHAAHCLRELLKEAGYRENSKF